ncbi:NIPSNAP protein [Klenkia soli]|uniref:NIPSNAP protein n=1 Tax=Klenkia soli TaxID=1052260 RepID=A0A1H0P382_9ACTN|nr:NIPSNAP family protein [Klenkia soli]SDO99156.1 NIPSNAP protein [Klenkia soli]
MTVQLRRYTVEPGRMAEFVAWFPRIVPVREQFGFRVLEAWVDEANHAFVWSVELDGDEARFTEVETTYNASPERAAAFETFPKVITAQLNAFVRPAR